MANFFTDNRSLVFQFERLRLEVPVAILEREYHEALRHDSAPASYAEAIELYRAALGVAGDLAANYIAPRARAVDREGARLEDGVVRYAEGTREAYQRLAEAGLLGVVLPRRFGGANFPATVYLMMVELISRADAALFTLFGYQDVVEAIARFGSEAQAMRLLPAYCRGDAKCAMVLTEPEAGSDLQAVRLSAVCDAHGQWRLRGVKRFISNGSAEILLVLARSEPEANNVFALSLFVAAADASVHVTRVEDKMGLHGSPTCELYFEDTPAQLLGKRRYGLIRYTMFCLQHARLSVAAQALGIAEAAYAEALAWAKQRRQFGTTIYEKAPVANLLIEMRVAIESCRTLLYAAAQWLDLRNQLELRIAELKAAAAPYAEQKRRFDQADGLVAMLSGLVKYVVSERANEVCYNAVQIHGGSGYMRETRACQLALDVRITSIYEGTSQIHVIGSTRGVFSDILGDFFDEQARRPRSGESLRLAERLLESRATFQTCLRTIKSRKDEFRELAAKELVDLYAQLYIGYLLLGEADQDHDRLWIARRFIVGAWAQAAARQRAILDELFADLGDRDRML